MVIFDMVVTVIFAVVVNIVVIITMIMIIISKQDVIILHCSEFRWWQKQKVNLKNIIFKNPRQNLNPGTILLKKTDALVILLFRKYRTPAHNHQLSS